MNPLSAPTPEESITLLKSVESGQKMVILAILMNICSIALQLGVHLRIAMIIGGLIALASVVISIIGVLRMSTGLRDGIPLRILFCILMLIPCISLIFLLVLNARATQFLKDNGYKVGLLGATKG